MLTPFIFKPGADISHTRVETMDSLDNLFCYGDSKGFVYVNQLEISENEFIIQDVQKKRYSKYKIDKLEILKLTKLLVVLTDGKVVVLNPATLDEKIVLLKSGGTSFAINFNECIAIAAGKKVVFFIFDLKVADFKPLTLGKTNEVQLHDAIIKLIWNNDILGVVTKKNYCIIDPMTIKIQELCPLNNTLYPHLLVYKDYWVAITGDNAMIFESRGKPVVSGMIDLQATQKNSQIYAVTVQNYYLIVLKDEGAIIYNLQDFTKTQKVGFDKGWAYKDYAIDHNNIFIIQDIAAGPKKEIYSRLNYLEAVPYDEQIKKLLAKGSVKEAIKVFEQNSPKTNPNFEQKKERFNLEAAWVLFINYCFEQSIEFFLQVNYDPRELLALVPGLLPSGQFYKSFKTLIEEKDQDIQRIKKALNEAQSNLTKMPAESAPEQIEEMKKEIEKLTQDLKDAQNSSAPKVEQLFKTGKKTILKLVEEKRRYLEKKYDLNTDGKKAITFLTTEKPINVLVMPKAQTLDEIMEILDTCLLKLFVEEHEINEMYEYISKTAVLKCKEDEMDKFLNDRKDKDKTFTAHACQALLEDRFGNYANALKIWKAIGQETREARTMACKETLRILMTKAEDKKIITTYARTILIVNPDDGLKIFTESEGITKIISEDETLTYLEGLETFQPQLRERYLEYLINRKDSQEHFFTLLAVLYANRLKTFIKEGNTLNSDKVIESRKKLDLFIKDQTKYNPASVIEEIKGLELYDIEIFLYTKQKLYGDAIEAYVKMGKEKLDFSGAEEYCLNNSEPLLGILFQKVMSLYNELKGKITANSMLASQELIKKQVLTIENYAKDFLKKYATNEKLLIEQALEAIPEEWSLSETESGEPDDSLMQYLTMSLNDRNGKEISTEIERRSFEMNKLDLDGTLVNLQKAHLLMNQENICKVCRKKLSGSKTFYVYPNGVVVHERCAKDTKICPVYKINFAKKVYV